MTTESETRRKIYRYMPYGFFDRFQKPLVLTLLAEHDAEVAKLTAELAAEKERVRVLIEAADAVLTNEKRAFSGGMCSYQKGSQTWQVYEDLRAVVSKVKTQTGEDQE